MYKRYGAAALSCVACNDRFVRLFRALHMKRLTFQLRQTLRPVHLLHRNIPIHEALLADIAATSPIVSRLATMVCAKCAKLSKTSLATAEVKRKSDSITSTGISYSSKPSSAASGPSGIGKSKLLSKAAKNPYAAYSASCEKCKVKVQQGHKFCQKCAYKDNVCAGCGRKEKAAGASTSVVQGQKFSAK